MNSDHFVELFHYTHWANQHVWDCVAKVSDEDYFKDQTFSVGSVYSQLFHWMSVERWWSHFLITGELEFPTKEDVERCRDRTKLRERWDETHQQIIDYVSSLTDDELQRKVKPSFWDDADPPITVAQALTQVINHSTDHRAQTMAVLHTMGYDGVGQDFLSYLHETIKEK
ncbi:MAG: DinB family protein [Chloroflexota bacterium]